VIGIYVIRNVSTGDKYIGSSIDVESRIRTHLYDLRGNRHVNSKLQNAWNKYGESSFEFGIQEDVGEQFEFPIDRETLFEVEQWYLDRWRPAYNLVPIAGSPARDAGWRHTEQTKLKMSISRWDRPHPVPKRGAIRVVDKICEFCGTVFVVYLSHNGRRFCSKTCTYNSRRRGAPTA